MSASKAVFKKAFRRRIAENPDILTQGGDYVTGTPILWQESIEPNAEEAWIELFLEMEKKREGLQQVRPAGR